MKNFGYKFKIYFPRTLFHKSYRCSTNVINIVNLYTLWKEFSFIRIERYSSHYYDNCTKQMKFGNQNTLLEVNKNYVRTVLFNMRRDLNLLQTNYFSEKINKTDFKRVFLNLLIIRWLILLMEICHNKAFTW